VYAEQVGALNNVGKGTVAELRPGDTKRLDLNGDYKITDLGNADSDLQYIGDANPHFVYGLTVGASWKGIDVSAMFQGVAKQYIMRNDWMAYPSVQSTQTRIRLFSDKLGRKIIKMPDIRV